jgi:hypothetical protein
MATLVLMSWFKMTMTNGAKLVVASRKDNKKSKVDFNLIHVFG